MAIATTCVVEGGKISSINSVKEVLVPHYTDLDLAGKQRCLFLLMKWTNVAGNSWAKTNVGCHRICFSHYLEVNNTLSSIWCFIFPFYLVLLLNLECQLNQEVLFHPFLHGGLGFLKKGRRHGFICRIFHISFTWFFPGNLCFIKAQRLAWKSCYARGSFGTWGTRHSRNSCTTLFTLISR